MTNSADPDQLASSEANWSGPTLFAKAGYPSSAEQGLTSVQIFWNSICYLFLLSTLGKIFSRQHTEIFFLFFPNKQDLTFHANCLQWSQFAWNIKSCFLGKIRKNIISLWSAELAKRVVKVKDNLIMLNYFLFSKFKHNCNERVLVRAPDKPDNWVGQSFI